MDNTTTTTAKPKQITCGINAQEKELIRLFSEELTRPAAVKGAAPVGASEREILEIALKVATDYRFHQELVSPADIAENPETGELVEVPAVYEWVDRFEQEWNKIKIRDYSTPGVRVNKVVEEVKGKHSAAVAQLRALYAAQGMTPEAIELALVGLV